jgi:hypothetical protein
MNKCQDRLNSLLRSYDEVRAGKQDNVSLSPQKNQLFALFSQLESSKLKIQCEPCSHSGVEGSARAFLSSYPFSITLCANRLDHYADELQEALVHEVVHAFDLYHSRCDFGTCEGLAHSEIRAARQAECSALFPRIVEEQFPRWRETGLYQAWQEHCVKSCATQATGNIHGKEQAKICVDRVWEKAWSDIEPQVK